MKTSDKNQRPNRQWLNRVCEVFLILTVMPGVYYSLTHLQAVPAI